MSSLTLKLLCIHNMPLQLKNEEKWVIASEGFGVNLQTLICLEFLEIGGNQFMYAA